MWVSIQITHFRIHSLPLIYSLHRFLHFTFHTRANDTQTHGMLHQMILQSYHSKHHCATHRLHFLTLGLPGGRIHYIAFHASLVQEQRKQANLRELQMFKIPKLVHEQMITYVPAVHHASEPNPCYNARQIIYHHHFSRESLLQVSESVAIRSHCLQSTTSWILGCPFCFLLRGWSQSDTLWTSCPSIIVGFHTPILILSFKVVVT